MIVFAFTSDWMKKWREFFFFSQSWSVVDPKPITFRDLNENRSNSLKTEMCLYCLTDTQQNMPIDTPTMVEKSSWETDVLKKIIIICLSEKALISLKTRS